MSLSVRSAQSLGCTPTAAYIWSYLWASSTVFSVLETEAPTLIIGAIPCVLKPSTCIHAILLLLPNGIGVIIGILLGAKLISILLKKVPGLTYAVIVGLIVGSAYTLFPGFSEIHSAGRAIGCVITLCAGIALAFFSSVVTEPKKDKTNPEGEQN